MNYLKNLLSISIILSLGLTSCTVEKRLYTSGYHIDWHYNRSNRKDVKIVKKETKLAVLSEKTESPTINTEIELNEAPKFTANVTEPVKPEVKTVEVVNTPVVRKSATKQVYQDIRSGMKMAYSLTKAPAKATADEPKKTNGLAIAGFIIGIVGWFMPIGLGMTMCAIAIIFGAISMSKIKKNPEMYKGKGLAVTALIVGIVGLLILLLLA